MANADIAKRLALELDAFEGKRRSVADLQGSLLAHGYALEAMPHQWRDRLDTWEGELELARFTASDPDIARTADRVIREVREALAPLLAA